MAEYKEGDHVRFTSGPLGIIDPNEPSLKFVEAEVAVGEEGSVATPPGAMPDGWLAVEPDLYPGKYVPVHPGMIEHVKD